MGRVRAFIPREKGHSQTYPFYAPQLNTAKSVSLVGAATGLLDPSLDDLHVVVAADSE